MNTIEHEFLIEAITFDGPIYRKVIAKNKKEAIENVRKLLRLADIKDYTISGVYNKTIY